MIGLGRYAICLTMLAGCWVMALTAANTSWSLPVAVAAFVAGVWLVLSEGRA